MRGVTHSRCDNTALPCIANSFGRFLETLEISGPAQGRETGACDPCVTLGVTHVGHAQAPCSVCLISPVTHVTHLNVKRLLESGQGGRAQGERGPGGYIGKSGSRWVIGSRPHGTAHHDPFADAVLETLETLEIRETGDMLRGSFPVWARRGGRGAPAFHAFQIFWNRESTLGVLARSGNSGISRNEASA